MKKISILGSTGSIGTQTLEVISASPDLFKVVALAGGKNIKLLKQQIKKYSPKLVAVSTKEIAEELKSEINDNIKVYYGEEGLIEAATADDVDYVVVAVVGSIGLKPTIKAIEAKKQIGLANKETLVSAGHIVMKLSKENDVPIIPIDSEHSAIYQSLNGENRSDVSKIILTASGGSFRNLTREELKNVSIADALNHPNWSMGRKITIDSATMMNKGLEVIEAHWLFNMPYKQIEVVIHPQSIIHSMVEFRDKAIIAQLGTPDMKVPIQYAISYPNRIELNSKALDLTAIRALHFYKPDYDRFPSLRLAFQTGEEGGSLPTVLNAANEVAVDAFLNGKIAFLAIEDLTEEVLGKHNKVMNPDIETIYQTDKWARQKTYELIKDRRW